MQKGYLSDVPGLNYYFIKRKCWTGFVYYRNIRSSSALEAYHLHFRAAQHPCAKGSGPRPEMARTLLFDFAWNVKAAVSANQQPDSGHFNLWLVDALADLVDGWLEADDLPSAMSTWVRTNTMIEPTTFRGIDWATTKALGAQGVKAVEVSSLILRAERKKVLKHPLLLAHGDAAGIARKTGIITSDKILKALAAEMAVEARTRQLLEAHGVQNLGQRLRRTAQAERAMRAPPGAPPVPRMAELGPLPMDSDVVRPQGGAVSGGVVAMDAELPPVEEEETAEEEEAAEGQAADAAEAPEEAPSKIGNAKRMDTKHAKNGRKRESEQRQARRVKAKVVKAAKAAAKAAEELQAAEALVRVGRAGGR